MSVPMVRLVHKKTPKLNIKSVIQYSALGVQRWFSASRLALLVTGFDVDNFEFFDVVDRIRAERKFCTVGFFDPEE
jgi:hypothetical protein